VVRILGRDLSPKKRVTYALTAIYGIGIARSKEILQKANLIDTNKNILKIKDLSDLEISKIRSILENDYKLEGDLKRLYYLSIRRLKENGCLRGRRHIVSLPVRGQRTKTNARTRKGTKRTVPSKKK
jgi:small subunit ribosomal protein S13